MTTTDRPGASPSRSPGATASVGAWSMDSLQLELLNSGIDHDVSIEFATPALTRAPTQATIDAGACSAEGLSGLAELDDVRAVKPPAALADGDVTQTLSATLPVTSSPARRGPLPAANSPGSRSASQSTSQSTSHLDAFSASLAEKEGLLSLAFDEVEELTRELRRRQQRLDARDGSAPPPSLRARVAELEAAVQERDAALARHRRENRRLGDALRAVQTAQRSTRATGEAAATQLAQQTRTIADLRRDVRLVRALAERHKAAAAAATAAAEEARARESRAAAAAAAAARERAAVIAELEHARADRPAVQSPEQSTAATQTATATSADSALWPLVEYLLRVNQVYERPQEVIQLQALADTVRDAEVDANDTIATVDRVHELVSHHEAVTRESFPRVLASVKHVFRAAIVAPGASLAVRQLFLLFVLHLVRAVPDGGARLVRGLAAHVITCFSGRGKTNGGRLPEALVCYSDAPTRLLVLLLLVQCWCSEGPGPAGDPNLEYALEALLAAVGGANVSDRLIARHLVLQTRLVDMLLALFERWASSGASTFGKIGTPESAASSASAMLLHLCCAEDGDFVSALLAQCLQHPRWAVVFARVLGTPGPGGKRGSAAVDIQENCAVVVEKLARFHPLAVGECPALLDAIRARVASAPPGAADFATLNLRATLQLVGRASGEP